MKCSHHIRAWRNYLLATRTAICDAWDWRHYFGDRWVSAPRWLSIFSKNYVKSDGGLEVNPFHRVLKRLRKYGFEVERRQTKFDTQYRITNLSGRIKEIDTWLPPPNPQKSREFAESVEAESNYKRDRNKRIARSLGLSKNVDPPVRPAARGVAEAWTETEEA